MSEIAYWVRLLATEGIGGETTRKLLAAFGLPEQIFSTSYAALRKVVSDKQATALLAAPSDRTHALIERTDAWLGEPNNFCVTLADVHYPPQLLEIPDPPPVLYVKGRIELLSGTSMAVVGSRHATTQGALNAQQFSNSLSQAGITITSGLALGIDAAAHIGALECTASFAGSTIAVIGTGADVVYPARNRDLAHRVVQHGCIVSEYPLGTPAIASNFPRRNRIISGLSRGVLVVEAALQSGSLITARMALEQGRDVFAIPGSIHSPLAKGCHALIKQGAKLVETADDILSELRLDTVAGKLGQAKEAPVVSHEYAKLIDGIGFDPVHPDMLAQHCDMEVGVVQAQLLALELDGQVEMLVGGFYRRVH